MADQSAARHVLADHSKVGVQGGYGVAPIAHVHTVLTNAHLSQPAEREQLRAAGVHLIEA